MSRRGLTCSSTDAPTSGLLYALFQPSRRGSQATSAGSTAGATEEGASLRSEDCQTLASCSRGLLGPGSGHPGDRACLGRAAAPRGPRAALFTVAQAPGQARSPWEVTAGGWGGRGTGWVLGADESCRNQTRAHVKRRREEEAQANRRAAGMIGLVSHSGRWRQRWRHPPGMSGGASLSCL